METTAAHQNRPGRSAANRPALSVEEIEAWLAEVGPVARAIGVRGGVRLPGRRRWLAAQVRLATDALDLLACEAFEAEALGRPCQDVEWLHTRVAALLEAVADRPALPVAA